MFHRAFSRFRDQELRGKGAEALNHKLAVRFMYRYSFSTYYAIVPCPRQERVPFVPSDRERIEEKASERARKRTRGKSNDRRYARVYFVVTRGALPFNRWLDSPTRSFIHTRGTRFESISKTRKRIFPAAFLRSIRS